MTGREGADMTRSCRSSSPASPESLPEVDDLLWEILLRLPPQPSSLSRASAVCKRWRRLVTDRQFLHRFRVHHRKPPLLGVFECQDHKIVFRSTMDPPDRIPPNRFDLGRCSIRSEIDLLGCWHGRVLVHHRLSREVVVCAPMTGDQRRVAIPYKFPTSFLNGAVLCAASDQGHVHGSCHLSPFKLVLVSMLTKENRIIARVYSSETRAWGNLISMITPEYGFYAGARATLVGNSLYWPLFPGRDGILEFDLKEQSLAVIMGPPVKGHFYNYGIIRANDGDLGLALLIYPRLQMWKRNINGHDDVSTWVLGNTIDLHNILGLSPQIEPRIRGGKTILGYSEDIDVIFIWVGGTVYMVQLKSMESKRLYESHYKLRYHLFTSFYTPGATIAGGCAGAKMLH